MVLLAAPACPLGPALVVRVALRLTVLTPLVGMRRSCDFAASKTSLAVPGASCSG